MEVRNGFLNAFRRGIGRFPSAAVVVEADEASLKPDGFCVASFDPPIVALTFARSGAALPATAFSVAAVSEGGEPAVRLECTLLDGKEVGDHWMLFAAVHRLEVTENAPVVRWSRADFRLHLEYPFLESAEVLDRFVNDWETGVLEKSAWTHSAHVAVTGYYALNQNAESVYESMKRGILHFTRCKGIVNGPDQGYHETLTRFWAQTIAEAVERARPGSRLEAAKCAVRQFGEDRDLPALYYSFDVTQNRTARAQWIAPDRAPNPEWRGARSAGA